MRGRTRFFSREANCLKINELRLSLIPKVKLLPLMHPRMHPCMRPGVPKCAHTRPRGVFNPSTRPYTHTRIRPCCAQSHPFAPIHAQLRNVAHSVAPMYA